MFLSEDEQDDNNVFDQLKSIKAFTVDQLYSIYPDVGCPPTQPPNSYNPDQSSSDAYHDQILYQNLVEYEQLRHKLANHKAQVKQLHRKTLDHIDKVWVFNEETPRKIGMCQQGKIAETTFKYKQAFVNSKQLNVLNLNFSELSEMISKDYIYYSFESQMKRHKIATQLSISYQIPDQKDRIIKLRSAITTLVDFLRHLGDSKSDFVLQCRKWLRGLIKRFLEQETTDEHRFIISQLCKGPAGTADWSADLIECKPFEQVSEFESTPRYITHCAALLNELFNNLRHRIRRVQISTGHSLDNQTSSNDYSDQNWSLIDPRFSCTEELSLSSCAGNRLSESDVIKLCLRIPVAQIFRAFVKKCLASDDECHLGTDKDYKYIMLKLLTIGTIIIRTYQTGLETFNSIQYGSLIEYLSSQIRRTVIVLSDQWAEFKRRLKGVDNALWMRLQVEYDNFILRSILIILELRQSGIWRHLSRIEHDGTHEENDGSHGWSTDSLRPAFVKLLQVTGLTSPPETPSSPTIETDANQITSSSRRASNSLTYEFSNEWFKEVSEPMLWHILWQFYHSAFVSSCDYHSDNYWLEKFREKSVVYLFVNKIRDSSVGECNYLLNSITNMLLSRTRQDSKLVSFIATEIFNLSFRQPTLREKITKKGTRSLIRCAEKFPNLISLFMNFMVNEELDEDIVELIKGCSLTGWICDDNEVEIIARWLIEYSICSPHSKIARLLISKLLLNSQEYATTNNLDLQSDTIYRRTQTRSPKDAHCFVDLKLRRKFALLLYEASVHHLPSNNDFGPQSLGASVEVAFGGLFCERSSTLQNNLIELAIDTSYQQLYVWIWRLLSTFRLHILNQPDTDWNDVQSRSGTSRSIKNTVLFNDSFHPVPSIQDSECLILSEGAKNQNPMASFIYLLMTDVTWQQDTLDSCVSHLNMMANSGHLTPSLVAMKYLTICHLNELSDSLAKDPKCLEYFTTIITSNFDATRLASLIVSQMHKLKQYRQLQLSQFYITILLEVATVIVKRISSSWFSGDEYSLEKIACLLDYIVKFNFTTQRLEIIRKFYDCSYSIQGNTATSGWFGSLFATNSLNANSTRREFLTTLHVLTQKFKKYTWLRWVTTECDTLRLEKIWEDIVVHISFNEGANLDSAMKKVCPQVNPTILKSTLPIYSWIRQIFDIVESDLSHPLCPLLWYNFFLNYFANSLNGVSVGLKLVPQETLTKLLTRLDSLFNYHLYKHRNWTSTQSTLQQNSLAQLYRAYRLWLQDSSLQDAYVDIDRLREEYLVPLLKTVMESSTEGTCLQYIDIQSIETQNRNLSQVWLTATRLEGNHLIKDMIFVDSNHDESMEILTSVDDEASDAASLIVKPYKISPPEMNKSLIDADDELKTMQLQEWSFEEKYRTVEEIMNLVKRNFHIVFEESSIFGSNISELDKMKSEIVDLIQQLYTNKKREHVRVVPCADGAECSGPARIKFEVEEATIDDRKSECIQHRRQQCEELVGELLLMPTGRTVQSTILIEDNVKQLINDTERAKFVIESLLKWISEPDTYNQLNGSYHAANHLLKTVLEILCNTDEVDTYNTTMIDVCLEHPGSVQIFSPHLSPSSCSSDCFLSLYKKISAKHSELGPIATFVLLSKFDVNSWLNKNKDKAMHHDIIKTTCSALKAMGKHPDDSFNLTFDLYKRHIQVELAPPDRRRPEEISLVMSQFLAIMDEQSLAPSLWVDFMSVLGLEKHVPSLATRNRMQNNGPNIAESPQVKSRGLSSWSDSPFDPLPSNIEHDESTIANVIEDVARLADCQMVFDYHALNNMMQMISQFLSAKYETIDTTLLELYQDYLEQFSLVMISISFMWLRAVGEQYPDNHSLIWKQFLELWYHWVFLSKNCQNVGKTSYSLIANQYVAALRYMIYRIPDNTQSILQSVLSSLADYVKKTKEVVYLELTILQRCLKHLHWSNLVASPEDFENLAILSEQENYNISDLVSHILLQINIKESLSQTHDVDPTALPHVAERLATTIVLQSSHLKGFRLHGCYFTLIPVDRISRIASLILPRMEFANLEHSQNNKLLVNLLRLMCIKLDLSDSTATSQYQVTDSFDRSIIYAQFVSNYLVDLIKNHPPIVKYHKPYLNAVIGNSLNDLKILLSPDVDITKKTAIYESLLECCSSNAIDEDSRLLIAKSLVKSNLLENRPIVVMEIFHAIGQIIYDGRVLVYTIEKMVNLYLDMNGHYEKVWKSFCLKVLPSDLYLEACIEEKAPLALLVYFEALSRNGQESSQHMGDDMNTSSNEPLINNNKIWASFFHWISQLSVVTYVNGSNELKSNDTKLSIAWLRLLDMLEPNLYQFIHCNRSTNKAPTIQDTEGNGIDQGSEGDTMDNSRRESQPQQQQRKPTQDTTMLTSHKSLVGFIKQLISMYDLNNSGGLWSYLKSTRTEQTSRVSIIALAVACFLADRTLTCLTNSGPPNDDLSDTQSIVAEESRQQKQNSVPMYLSVLKDEISKLRKSCLSKLEAARKSKYYLENAQFIETLIESVNRNDKVQYSEGVQLITTFFKSIYSSANSDDCVCISKILPSFNE